MALAAKIVAKRFGKYELKRRLATGGMAEIFLAQIQGVEGFEKPFVVKRMLPHLADDPQFVSMFVDEAKLASTLTHPNIVQVHELGCINGRYFIAMEYIDGIDLATLRNGIWEAQQHMPFGAVLAIILETARGLQYAHDKRVGDHAIGLVHRDISPQNILISREGFVKITDFGIAKAEGRATKTQSGVLKGKFSYMAPEQAFGKPIDRRADIFALGLVAYELFGSRRAYAGRNDLEMLEMAREAQLPRLDVARPEIPTSVADIIHRALAPNLEARYASCHAFAQDLLAATPDGAEPWDRARLATLVEQYPGPAATSQIALDEDDDDDDLEDVTGQEIDRRAETVPISDSDIRVMLRIAQAENAAGAPAGLLGNRAPYAPLRTPRSRLLLGLLLGLLLATLGALAVYPSHFWEHTGPGGTSSQQTMSPRPQPVQRAATRAAVVGAQGSNAVRTPSARDPEHATPAAQPASTESSDQLAGNVTAPSSPSQPAQPERHRRRHRSVTHHGFLTINSRPWSYVSIDGKKQRRSTPLQAIRLPVGRHKIKLDSPGAHATREFSIEVRRGRTTTKIVTF